MFAHGQMDLFIAHSNRFINYLTLFYFIKVKWFVSKYCYAIPIIRFYMGHFFIPLDYSKYRKWLDISIWPTNGTLTGTTIPGQSWPVVMQWMGTPYSSELQNWSLTIKCLIFMSKTFVRGCFTTAEMQSAYSIAQNGVDLS